jgi:hypothetical protein
MSGSGSVRLIVGGAVRSSSALTVNTASIAPAAPSRCPVAAFVALTTMSSSRSPNTARIDLYSAMSPTGVLVACALMCATSSGEIPAFSSASRIVRGTDPSGLGSGALMWKASLVTAPPSTRA